MFQQPSTVRPATGPTNFVAHPSIRGFKQPSATHPATGPTNLVAHPSIRGLAVLQKRCSLKNKATHTLSDNLDEAQDPQMEASLGFYCLRFINKTLKTKQTKRDTFQAHPAVHTSSLVKAGFDHLHQVP